MEIESVAPINRIGFFQRMAARINGADIELLKQSPQRDVETICATALLLVFAAIFQGSEFAIVAHQVFVQDNDIHPALIAGAVFLALRARPEAC